MKAVTDWLVQLHAGLPSWAWILIAIYSVVEYVMPRTESVKARSILEGIVNVCASILRAFAPPAAAEWLQKFGTPPVPKLSDIDLLEQHKGVSSDR